MSEELNVAEAPYAATPEEEGRKTAVYGGLVAILVVVDAVTKYIVQQTLEPYRPVPVWGDIFRLTYIYNPGAAFGLHLGPFSRYIFLRLTVACLVVLFLWFRNTPPADRLRLLAIALVAGGAIGNFIDRVRSPRGVVDFLDFGLGDLRWPVFNVADMGVTVGAVLLAISLWREEQESRADDG